MNNVESAPRQYGYRADSFISSAYGNDSLIIEGFFCIITHVLIVIKIAKKIEFITEIWQNFSKSNRNTYK